MKTIEESIQQYFENTLTSALLLEMVQKQFNDHLETSKLVKEQEDAEIRELLPTIKITEAWGQPGSKDRQIIEEFTSKIKGDTVEAKLDYLSKILSGTMETAPSLGDILATLLLIEVLNSILKEFTEAAGGFIFEGFLAGLFGGQAVQITGGEDDDTGAMGKPITDVRLGDKEYSLKLLGSGTDVKGSFKNMVEHFKVRDHVIYLDARRVEGEGLQFGEFTITLEGFLDVFVTPFLKHIYKSETEIYKEAEKFQTLLKQLSEEGMAIKRIQTAKIDKAWRAKTGLEGGLVPSKPGDSLFVFSPTKGTEMSLQEAVGLNNKGMSALVGKIISMPTEELQKYAPFSIIYAEAKFEGTKAEKLFGSYAVVQQLQRAIESGDRDSIIKSLEKTPGYGPNPQQFVFTRAQVEERIKNFRHVGFLPIGEATLKKAWLNYGERLNNTLRPVYGTLNMFTKNVNSYFLGTSTKEKDRKSFGADAIKDAQNLKMATNKAIEAVEKSEK